MTARNRKPRKPGKDRKSEEEQVSATDIHGPSPDPATNLLITDLALRGGAMLVRQGIERGLLGAKYAPKKAERILKGRTIGTAVAHSAIAKLATKSVPGAILVGGGLLAKTLYDRRKGEKARKDGEAKLEKMAKRGDESEQG